LRERIAFLTRVVILKLAALFTFVALSLYTPSATNSLLDGAGGVAVVFAKGTENSLRFVGSSLGGASILVPRKGAVELAFRFVAMDKVMLFIGITIVLYLGWMVLIALTQGLRRKPARLRSVGTAPR
jgi:hypothetical protein